MELNQIRFPRIFILGDGVFAKELKVYFETIRMFDIILVGKDDINNYHEKLDKYSSVSIMGSGQCTIKMEMLKEIKGKITKFCAPSASIFIQHSAIGEGSVIAPGVVLAPYCKIGKHVLVNYNATIGHNTIIGDLSVVSPNAAVGGSCVLGRGVYVGAGASIRENLHIADGVIIGMGAVVINDVIIKDSIVVGIPAKPKVGLLKQG